MAIQCGMSPQPPVGFGGRRKRNSYARQKVWILSLSSEPSRPPRSGLRTPPSTNAATSGSLARIGWDMAELESASWTTGRGAGSETKIVLTDHSFALTGFRGHSNAWTGTYALGAGNALDLRTEDYDIGNPGGTSLVVPSSDVRAIYKLDRASGGDRLTICYSMSADQPRFPDRHQRSRRGQ